MDYKIRTVTTRSKKSAVQVYKIVNRKRQILKHVGSGKTIKEISALKQQAENWINLNNPQKNLFKDETDVYFKSYKYLGFTYKYAYEFLEQTFQKFNFHLHTNTLIKDLIIAHILEPSSKRQNLLNLEQYFGIKHNLSLLYRHLSKFDEKLKVVIEQEVVEIAKEHFNFDFSFVLYDVTTLYFESFKNDEFRVPGFSKDNKHNQPQVVIGLMVTKDGFPVHYEIFKGNTFEGKTFLPSILKFKEQYDITSITVVADSAMLSVQNLDELIKHNINYIIAARLGNLNQQLTTQIDQQLERKDLNTIRIDDLIVEYRYARYKKDLKEMEKQLEKAKKYDGVKTTKITKLKFLQNTTTTYSLNHKLLERTKILLGLKGYITNLNLSDKDIVDYYHNLFKIEAAFRIAKSDLEIRPIYHYKENTIKNHVLICFMCLAMSVYLELKNQKSIKVIVKALKAVTDGIILNTKTGQILQDRSEIKTPLLH